MNLSSLFHSIYSLASGLIYDLWLFKDDSVTPEASRDLLGKDNLVLGFVLLAKQLQLLLSFLS